MRIPKRAKRVTGREWVTVTCDRESYDKLERLAKAGSLAGLLRCIADNVKRIDLVYLTKRRYGG